MAEPWRSINDLYYRKPVQEQKQKPAETEEEQQPRKKEEPELRLISGKWVAGADGFKFNKKCKVQVKVEFLKKTQRRRVFINPL